MKNALPKSEMVDVGDATMRMRMIKSAEEISVIKNGARIADIGGFACLPKIAADVPEYEIAMTSTQAMIREIAATYPHAELMDSKCLNLAIYWCAVFSSMNIVICLISYLSFSLFIHFPQFFHQFFLNSLFFFQFY